MVFFLFGTLVRRDVELTVNDASWLAAEVCVGFRRVTTALSAAMDVPAS